MSCNYELCFNKIFFLNELTVQAVFSLNVVKSKAVEKIETPDPQVPQTTAEPEFLDYE